MFKGIRVDIRKKWNNLFKEQDLRNINDQDDDDWSEVLDPISGPKATQEKISKGLFCFVFHNSFIQFFIYFSWNSSSTWKSNDLNLQRIF